MRITVLIWSFLLLCSCNGQSQLASKRSSDQGEFKRIEFGFNTTYLASSPKFEVALEKIQNDGFKKIRIYEPFTKKMKDNPELGWQHLQWLKGRDFEVLMSLSNFPYKDKPRQKQLEKLPSKQRSFPKKAIKYSNRYPPNNLERYREGLNSFFAELEQRDLLGNMEFEIGNEPNAPRYFWGNATDWKKVRNVMKETLAQYGKTGMCCGYTSSMFLQPDKDRHKPFIQDWRDDVQPNFQTSFHVYLQTGSGKANLVSPKLDVSGGMITEYGMFSHFTVEKASRKASSEYVAGFVQLLAFTFENNIEAVYLFPLMDDSQKKAKMGYFDKDGNPKESYRLFKQVWEVVKDGYSVKVANDRIEVFGPDRAIVYAKKQVEADANWHIQASHLLESGMINTNGWIIRDL